MPNLKVLFIAGQTDFPNGGASSSRIRLLCKCLADVGTDVSLVITKRKSELSNLCGNYHGIEYLFLIKDVNKKEKSLAKRIFNILHLGDYISLLKWARKERTMIGYDCILLYSRDILLVLLAHYLSNQLGVPLILEICEWPILTKTKNPVESVKKFLYCKYALKYADGAIPISTYINDEATKILKHFRKPIKVLKVPILVDTSEFNTGINNGSDYLLFAGSSGYRNILEIVLKSYSLLSNDFKKNLLFITGIKPESDDAVFVVNMAKDLDIEDKVHLGGYVTWEEYKMLLQNARLLLIPLPLEPRSVARFPTKVGDYLSSGRPIVTTAVGEIPYYLTNDVNAFIANPNDLYAYSSLMEFVMSNEETANKVGLEGRATAEKVFDYRVHGSKIQSFLLDIINTKKQQAKR